MPSQAKKPYFSVAVLAHNEARDLDALLATLSFADEVIVADAESSDETAAVARRAGAKVISVANDYNLNVNKSAAIAACRGDWLMYLDPDERVPAALAAAVRAAAGGDARYAAYEFPRLNNYFGRYLRHGGAYPDYQLRLFRRGRARFACRSVHERLEVDGPIGRLAPALLHETYPTTADYLRKLPFYVVAGADYFRRRRIPVNLAAALWFFLLRPTFRFCRRYFFRLAFLDGWAGLLACGLDAFQGRLSYFDFRTRRLGS